MKKDLIFITDNYPFGQGETFIENEINYLAENFRSIYIISKNQRDIQTRKVPKNCKIYRIKKDFKKLLTIYLDKIYLIDFFKEFELKNLKKLISFQYYSKLIENKIKEIIKENILKESNIILYSYWFYNGAYAGSVLKRKNKVKKVISRAHGYDLYLERGYQPLKKIILEDLDMLYPCSKLGEQYLKQLYYKKNIEYNYLGVNNDYQFIKRKKENKIKIVSCSNMIKLKRIDLIIKALSILENEYSNIEWVHFGDGIDRKYLENLAKGLLKKIDYKFMGILSNKKVLEYYQFNNVTLFINLSSTEGLPVSMMEAQSFGIPIVATAVGGVPEIVSSKNGRLISKDPTIEEIVVSIKEIINLSEEEYEEYRKNSFSNWENTFNSIKNYQSFIEKIL